MNLLAPDMLALALGPLWTEVKDLFREHHFITILCAVALVMMTVSFYRFLRNIHPALVGFVLLLMFGVLILHWTQTRTEPALLKPMIDFIAPFFPTVPTYTAPPKP